MSPHRVVVAVVVPQRGEFDNSKEQRALHNSTQQLQGGTGGDSTIGGELSARWHMAQLSVLLTVAMHGVKNFQQYFM